MEYKAPSIAKDYQVEWSGELPTGATVSSCVYTLETGLVEDSQSVSGTTSTIFISGGIAGSVYQVACSAIGSDGQTYNQTFFISVQLNIN